MAFNHPDFVQNREEMREVLGADGMLRPIGGFPGERRRRASVSSEEDSGGEIVLPGRRGEEPADGTGEERLREEQDADAVDGSGAGDLGGDEEVDGVEGGEENGSEDVVA